MSTIERPSFLNQTKTFGVRLAPVCRQIPLERQTTHIKRTSSKNQPLQAEINCITEQFREVLKSSSPLDVNRCGSLLHSLVERNVPKVFLQLFEEYQHAGGALNSFLAGTALYAYALLGDAGSACNFFDGLGAKGIIPNALMYNSILKIYANRGKISEMRNWMEKMQAAGLKNISAFHFLMETYGELHKTEKALAVLDEIKVAEIKPTTETYNLLFKVLGREGDQRAFSLFEKMKGEGLTANTETFESLIRAAVETKDSKKMVQFLEEMKQKNMKMSVEIMNLRLKFALEQGDSAKEAALLDEMHTTRISPDENTFYVRLKAYMVNDQWERALSLISELRKAYINLNEPLFKFIYVIYIKTEKKQEADALLREMEKEDVSPAVICSIRIYAWMVVRKIDEAEAVFLASKRENRLSLYNCNTMLQAYIHCQQLGKAIQLFSEMKAGLMPPDVVTYNTLIKGHLQVKPEDSTNIAPQEIENNVAMNRAEKAIALLTEMKQQSIEPSHVTYLIIRDYCRRNALKSPLHIIDQEIEAAGFGKIKRKQSILK